MEQSDRFDALDQVKHFKARVLICSDVISRGIDLDRVNLVINFDVPSDAGSIPFYFRLNINSYCQKPTFIVLGEQEDLEP